MNDQALSTLQMSELTLTQPSVAIPTPPFPAQTLADVGSRTTFSYQQPVTAAYLNNLNDSIVSLDIDKHNRGTSAANVDETHYGNWTIVLNATVDQNLIVGGYGTVATGPAAAPAPLSPSQVASLTGVIRQADVWDIVAWDHANGNTISSNYASLVQGVVPISQLPSSVLGDLQYQGTYDAATGHIGTLGSGGLISNPTKNGAQGSGVLGNVGWYYIVDTPGNLSINGVTPPVRSDSTSGFLIGDWIVSDGTNWNYISGHDQVISVFNRTGAIVATTGDYSVSQVTGAAPLASPTFTGTVALPQTTISGQLTSTVGNGTAPFVVTSSTVVANLCIGGNAATATTAVYANYLNISGTATTFAWSNPNSTQTYVWATSSAGSTTLAQMTGMTVGAANTLVISGVDTTFAWANTSDAPSYVWGTSGQGSSFLASTGNLSVKYAASAGSAPTPVTPNNSPTSAEPLIWGSTSALYSTSYVNCVPSTGIINANGFNTGTYGIMISDTQGGTYQLQVEGGVLTLTKQ